MKNMYKLFKASLAHVVVLISCVIGLSSCELFGLPYAYSFTNDPAPAFGEQNCTAYEFIKNNSEFTFWYEAIVHAGLEDVFTKPDSLTFFVLKDEMMTGWLTSFRYSCIEQVPVNVMADFLRSYIADGYYPSTVLTTSYISVPTLNDDYRICMRLYPNPSTKSQNLHSMQAGWEQPDPTTYYMNSIITSNIKCTNGVIQVMAQKFLIYKN